MLRQLLKNLVSPRPALAPEPQPRELKAAPEQRPNDLPESSAWLNQLVFGMFERLHTELADNFDADRYGAHLADAFDADMHARYMLFVIRNEPYFFFARQLLADETSRALFDALVLYRLLGHRHVRLPFDAAANHEALVTANGWKTADYGECANVRPLAIFTIPGNHRSLAVIGWAECIAATFIHRQYYYQSGATRIAPSLGDHVIDAGGCFGDTAVGFADAVGDSGHVYVFDPLPKHCEIARRQLALNTDLQQRISIFQEGLSDRASQATHACDSEWINPAARLTEASMSSTTIDDACRDGKVPRVDFIKMDIEGSELAALRGAEATLRKWKPKLAISLYHRPEDIYMIPIWIDSLGLGYRFHLDHYTIHYEETVLYAAVD